jgi:formamidopyrimidine-DNA glycosylase
MPELPEVEMYRLFLEDTALHQTIVAFEAMDPERQLTLPVQEFREAIVGRQFTGTYRIGKHLLVLLDSGITVSLHFGMTGSLSYYRFEEERPRFERAYFRFSNGFRLSFTDPRKFGRIGLAPNIETYISLKKLGPDALLIPAATLQKALARKKGLLKPLLLDQRVTAGIGNWIVDEVLYQAGLHPEREAGSLSEKEVRSLTERLHFVLRTAIDQEAEYGKFPADFLIHAREWDKSPYSEAGAHKHCNYCKTAIVKSYVGGRATYLCPACQPRPKPPLGTTGTFM